MYWYCISRWVFSDHLVGYPSPTMTQPQLLQLAWSLMQNEALTLYQSVKPMYAITSVSCTFIRHV